jgi:hypothetical protein
MSFVSLLRHVPTICDRRVLLLVVLPFLAADVAATGCPHCSGNFASCSWAVDGTCPTVTVVADNARIILGAATGVLTLTAIVKAKFLRAFSKTSLASLLTLFSRPAPGTPFVITDTTKGSAILSAVSFGQISVESALFQLSDLLEEAATDTARLLIKGRMESLKVLKPRVDQEGEGFVPVSLGIYSFIWAKCSEYVMSQAYLDRVSVDARDSSGSSGAASSSFTARVFRPGSMNDFGEIINLFIMICHGLAVASCMLLTEFFATVVYEGMRLRGDSWMLSHEVMLIMFRRVEDSGGRITLGSVFDDIYLNSIIEEAKSRVDMFFRTGAGNALRDGPPVVTTGVKYNGKFTADGKVCPHFNREDPKQKGKSASHPPDSLKPDGTCKFNHVCNKWVSDKGKNGRCLCTAGTPGHARFACDNPNRCGEAVQ